MKKTVRGYAVRFGRNYLLRNGTYERFTDTAFDVALSHRCSVPVRWQSHDDHAPVLGMARLFADITGLAFECEVDAPCGSSNLARVRDMLRRKQPYDQVSIGDVIFAGHRDDVYLDCPRCTVTHCIIGHLTICNDAAYGESTGAWLVEALDDAAPSRLRALASSWGRGRRSIARRSSVTDTRMPAAVAAYMVSNQHRFAAIRNAVARQMMRDGAGLIFSHSAFTKAAGFDGDWNSFGPTAKGT